MNSDVEILKSRINIVEIVGEKVRLKRSGANYFGLCPFHGEKSPSFSVNENIQLYKCFGCGKSGDVISFVMEIDHLEFREALEYLADKVGYSLTGNAGHKLNDAKFKEEQKLYKLNEFATKWFQKKLITDQNVAYEYAKKRGLTKELIDIFGIGYTGDGKRELTDLLQKKGLNIDELAKYGIASSKNDRVQDKFRNRIIFSIYDEKGRIVGFSGRKFLPDPPNFNPPKYLNSPETPVFKKSKILFGLYQAKATISKFNFVIVSEGQMNIISSYKVGVKNIVASLGTSFTTEHLKVLSRYTNNIYLAFDKDTAGKKAMWRTLEFIFHEDLNAKIIDWDIDYGKDPDEVIQKDANIWIDAVNHPLDPIEYSYKEFEQKHGLDNIDKLSNFARVVIKLVYRNNNEIKRQFYLKYLSDKLEIPIRALENLSKGIKIPEKNNVPPAILRTEQKEKIDTLGVFDMIFILLLQNWEEVGTLLLALDKDFLPERLQELYDCLSLFTDEKDINKVRECLDEEVRTIVDDYLLRQLMVDSTISIEEHITKLIEHSQNEYKKKLISEWKKNPEDKELLEKMNKGLKSR